MKCSGRSDLAVAGHKDQLWTHWLHQKVPMDRSKKTLACTLRGVGRLIVRHEADVSHLMKFFSLFCISVYVPLSSFSPVREFS